METRMERYRIYRNEIISEGALIDRLVDESNLSQQYKSKIDSLDKNILANMQINQSLARLVSINQNEMENSERMVHYMNLIDEKKINTISEEINEWNTKYVTHSVLDQKGNINRQWLSDDNTYLEYAQTEKNIELENTSWNNFQSNSKNQIIEINELSKIIDNTTAVEELKQITTYTNDKKSINKLVYILPSILSVVSLILVIAVIVYAIINFEVH